MRSGGNAARQADDSRMGDLRMGGLRADGPQGPIPAARSGPIAPAEFEPNWSMLVEFPEHRVRDRHPAGAGRGLEGSEARHASPGPVSPDQVPPDPAAPDLGADQPGRSAGRRPSFLLATMIFAASAAAGGYLAMRADPANPPPPAAVPGEPMPAAPPASGPASGQDAPDDGPVVAPVRAMPPVDGSEAPAPPDDPRPGAAPSDPLVARAQRGLSAAGFAPGPVDGVIGPQTRDAVRSFQRRIGVAVDGEIDAALLRRLGGFRPPAAPATAGPPSPGPARIADGSAGRPSYRIPGSGRTIVLWGGKRVFDAPEERPIADPGSGGLLR